MFFRQSWQKYSQIISKTLRTTWLKPVVDIAAIPLVSILVSAGYLGIRELGWLESWELAAFDRMMQWRPELKADERLLIVEITEADIQTQKQWPLSDAILARLLSRLEQEKPIAIGLDIYRDLAVEPGHQQWRNYLSTSDRLMAVCKVSDEDSPGVPPPEAIKPEQVGFADLVVDRGGILRRGLLFLEPSPNSRCQTPYSLSFQLAWRYLSTRNIEPKLNSQQQLQLGKALFKRFRTNSGGYSHADERGYQIILNYRSSGAVARTITLDDVFHNRFDPTWVNGKIVLVGVAAPSIGDAFYTPYSSSKYHNPKMYGVVVHGQLTSQIIAAALGERALIWYWSESEEVLWLLSWSLLGTAIAYKLRHPLHLFLVESGALAALVAITGFTFLQGGWLPFVPPALSLITSATIVVAYTAYRTQQEKQEAILQVQQQNRDLALLQSLLKEKGLDPDAETAAMLGTESASEQTDTAIAPNSQSWQRPVKNLLSQRYKVRKVLGSGGFAYTYLAEDTQRPGTPSCLVKHLKPARRDDSFLQVARRLFKTEAEILEKLGSHPQIPRLLAHFEENQEFYLVEEYIPGNLLSEELHQKQRLSESEVMAILKEILAILIYIHDHGVIHRDLKPSNIIRDQNGRLVLIDFGAVKQINPQEDTSGQGWTVAIGTRGYTPPEQYAGQPNFSSDLYALGMVAIQALTGITPDNLSFDKSTGELKKSYLSAVSPQFTAILNQMVRYHFKDRYQSAAAVLKDLEALKLNN